MEKKVIAKNRFGGGGELTLEKTQLASIKLKDLKQNRRTTYSNFSRGDERNLKSFALVAERGHHLYLGSRFLKRNGKIVDEIKTSLFLLEQLLFLFIICYFAYTTNHLHN